MVLSFTPSNSADCSFVSRSVMLILFAVDQASNFGDVGMVFANQDRLFE